jgi:type IV pilus assembly protein PilF
MRSPMRHYSRFLLLLAVIATTGCVTSGVNKSAGADPDAANQQHIRLALSYISSNNRDLARVHLKKAKAFNPRSVELYNGYALLYQMEQEFELAERYYRKALAADSDYTLAHYNYSAFLFNQGRMAEALEQMQLVTQDLGYERRPQAFYILGLSQKRLGDIEAAVESFEKATQLSAGFAPPFIEAAEIYFQQQNYPLSKMALDRFRQLSKPTPKSLWLSVRIEQRFGNRDKAASEGLKLKNLFPYSKENLEYQAWLKQ